MEKLNIIERGLKIVKENGGTIVATGISLIVFAFANKKYENF
ncbi:hypothetical protein [Tenacibaculum dicentrarchi]